MNEHYQRVCVQPKVQSPCFLRPCSVDYSPSLRRSFTMEKFLPVVSAITLAFFPYSSVQLILAPWSRSNWTHLLFPQLTARWRGVYPEFARQFTSMPSTCSSKYFKTSAFSLVTASWSGVYPNTPAWWVISSLMTWESVFSTYVLNLFKLPSWQQRCNLLWLVSVVKMKMKWAQVSLSLLSIFLLQKQPYWLSLVSFIHETRVILIFVIKTSFLITWWLQ